MSADAGDASRAAHAWADLRKLRIRTSVAQRIQRYVPATDRPLCDHSVGEQVIIGLDFGTAFTKAVVRFRRRDYLVDWSTLVSLEDPALLPTGFSEAPDGQAVLGIVPRPGWQRRLRPKVPLLATEPEKLSTMDVESAVLFVALAVREVQRWFRTTVPLAAGTPIRWRLHMGLPSESVRGARAELFRQVASRAMGLAMSPERVRRAAVASTSPYESVSVIPELQAQLRSYLHSPQRQRDLHALFDCGAGTLDIAFFNVHQIEQSDRISVFSSRVDELGAHFLLAAMAGKRGEGLVWRDDDANLALTQIAQKLNADIQDIERRASECLGLQRCRFNDAYTVSHRAYQTGDVMRGIRPLPLLLCGGGSKIDRIRENISRIGDELARHSLVRLEPIPIPDPPQDSLIGDIGDNYHRVTIAHGLCELPRNLGTLVAPSEIEAFSLDHRVLVDRDADR
ncbi:MAG: hypothetical protein KDI51_14450 [Xanthomonadales bacterium]|nr:hypothetical protein [Xanthomonadales bacterium]